MANEICLDAKLSVYKSSVMSSAVGRGGTPRSYTMTGTFWIEGMLSVATSATLIPMGQVVAPHWTWFKNLDSTNFIKIRNGSSGADVIKLKALEEAPVPLLDSGTFYAIADTAACLLEYMVFTL